MKKKENVQKNDKSVQCNSIKNVIAQLKTEIDYLLSQKENENVDDFVHVKKNVDFRESGKGKPYNFKLRNLYYNFRSRNIGLVQIGPIIQCVLDLFDINVENLPSKSTAASFTSEMGVVSRNKLMKK